jgi:putative membrane protein
MFKKSLVVIFVVVWLALAINPVDRGIWMLENFLVVTVFPVTLWLDKRYNFNDWTFFSLTAFVILHLFGAHMTYNSMAYFAWFSDWLGLQRNYYDQVIHLLFGLMVFVPFFEVFYHQGLSRKLSYLIAFLFITSIGAGYEILEWLSMAMFCQHSDAVCSEALTQGDIWDTQKDMLFAMIGSLIALLLHRMWSSKASTQEVGGLDMESEGVVNK